MQFCTSNSSKITKVSRAYLNLKILKNTLQTHIIDSIKDLYHGLKSGQNHGISTPPDLSFACPQATSRRRPRSDDHHRCLVRKPLTPPMSTYHAASFNLCHLRFIVFIPDSSMDIIYPPISFSFFFFFLFFLLSLICLWVWQIRM